MTERDDLGSFRPTRDEASRPQLDGRGRREPLRPDLPRPDPKFAVEHAPGPPVARRAPPHAPVLARPVPSPPHVARSDIEDLAEALPRVARTGPARPTGRVPGVLPAPVLRRESPRDGSGSGASAYRPATGHLPPGGLADDPDDDVPSNGLPRALRWIGVALVGGAAAAVAGAIALMLYAPVDLVRDRLVAEIKARTGRDLIIGGKPQISFWPNVAISVSDVTLSNPPGMVGASLVTMPRLDATIQLWPLLSKQVLVDRLVLQSPRFTLMTDAQGRRNWDFADAGPLDTHPLGTGPRRLQYAKVGPLDINDLPEELRDFAKGATDANRVTRATGADGVSLGRIRIIDGGLMHIDDRTKSGEEFKSIDMTIDAGDAKGPLQASGTFVWRGEGVRLDTRVMPMQALAAGTPAQATIALTSESGQLTFAGTAVGGAVPRLEGQVTAKTPSLAKASVWLGRPVVGEFANGPLTFKGRLVANAAKASLTETNLQAPDLSLTGALALDQTGARPKLTGSVRIADLNVEAFQRLRVLEAPARAQPVVPRASAPLSGQPPAPKSIDDLLRDPLAKPQVRGYLGREGWNEGPLDVSALGIIDIDLRLAFGRMTSQVFNTNQGQVHLIVNGRTAKLIVDDLALHEGKARGTFSFDAANAKPVVSVALSMDGVSLGPLLKDAGAGGLDGRAKVNINVSGMGQTERQIVDTLVGKAEISVPRGTMTGYDVAAIVRGLTQMKLPRGDPDPKAKTDFSDLGASFTIIKGVADNKDFRVVTQDARAIGTGQIALGPRTIDFTVRPKLTVAAQTPSGLGGQGVNLAALDLPVRITGPLARPSVSADFQALMANPAKALEAVDPATRKQVEDTVKGVLSGDEAAKAKARDVLNKLLGR